MLFKQLLWVSWWKCLLQKIWGRVLPTWASWNATIALLHQKTCKWNWRRRWWILLQISGYSQTLSGHQWAGLHSSHWQFLLRVWFLGLVSLRTLWRSQCWQLRYLLLPIPWSKMFSHWTEMGQAKKMADCTFIFHAWNKWEKPRVYT